MIAKATHEEPEVQVNPEINDEPEPKAEPEVQVNPKPQAKAKTTRTKVNKGE